MPVLDVDVIRHLSQRERVVSALSSMPLAYSLDHIQHFPWKSENSWQRMQSGYAPQGAKPLHPWQLRQYIYALVAENMP